MIGAESYFDCQLGCLACIVLHNTETLQALLWNWKPSASLSYSDPFKEMKIAFFLVSDTTLLKHEYEAKYGFSRHFINLLNVSIMLKELHNIELPPARHILITAMSAYGY